MGRSNGCEANRKRADAAKRHEKYAKEGNSQTAGNAQAMSITCEICFQQFMCTQRKAAEQHAESKHEKKTFAECFPNIDEATAGASTGGSKREAGKQKTPAEKAAEKAAAGGQRNKYQKK